MPSKSRVFGMKRKILSPSCGELRNVLEPAAPLSGRRETRATIKNAALFSSEHDSGRRGAALTEKIVGKKICHFFFAIKMFSLFFYTYIDRPSWDFSYGVQAAAVVSFFLKFFPLPEFKDPQSEEPQKKKAWCVSLCRNNASGLFFPRTRSLV